jgi:hypothetical protein
MRTIISQFLILLLLFSTFSVSAFKTKDSINVCKQARKDSGKFKVDKALRRELRGLPKKLRSGLFVPRIDNVSDTSLLSNPEYLYCFKRHVSKRRNTTKRIVFAAGYIATATMMSALFIGLTLRQSPDDKLIKTNLYHF